MSNTFRVIQDYTREFEKPMIRRKGDRIEVIRKNDGKYRDWYWCRDSEGIETWVPETLLEINGKDGFLKSDYTSWELTVSEGEIISVNFETGGWAFCTNAEGEEGWVPIENMERDQDHK